MAKCFCCNCNIETETSGNPIVIPGAFSGVVFRASGNYGSTIFDTLPSERDDLLQIIICDECIKKNVKRVTLIHNIKVIKTADSEPFKP